ncbi:hypothetical protein DW352_02645 [Pseudolabrys taiwanensis]|uniref:Uncharacterized protein n=1 Tax=Pseudolabrys taiwanensis TaxID=331696 RepID=A0A345ZRG5_9HYPH|nr:hypothetical protein [Pseudolabrys taiwanensis]AXK79512.1 hypothetical protein DW352_02645 [Pseudolabrys taiwanensis]
MRIVGAIVGLVGGLAAAAASAADLSVGAEGYGGYGGVTAGQIVVWDAQPGIVTRAYWLPPWRNRHYFPSNGEMPEVGRDEDLSKRSVPNRAQSFGRSWSATSANPGMPLTPPVNLSPDILIQPRGRW